MDSGKPPDSSSSRFSDATEQKTRFDFVTWWRRVNEPWQPAPETIRVACGLFAVMMVLIAVFRHRPEEPAIVVGRLFFVAYGAVGMLLVERASSLWRRLYVIGLAVLLPLFALYASLTADSAPDTLGFAALAILCPLLFVATLKDLLTVIGVLIASHAIYLSQVPDPSIGTTNHWILWVATIFLGSSMTFSLLVYRSHVRETERMLERARDQATASAQSRSELLASMGDEIRTPMNGITGLIDLVLDTELDVEQRRYLEMIKSDAHRLTSVLSDLLDMAKMHAHWLQLETRTFNLPDLLRATLTPMALRAEDEKVVLEWEMPRNLPIWVRGDAARLRQVLVNLVNYLIDFAQATQVTVIASRMVGRSKRDYVKVEIHDRKGSLTAQERDRIRTALVGLDAPHSKSIHKSGLGLAICAQLVHLMDGDIGLDEADRGSVIWFTILLPMDEDKQREVASKSRVKHRSGFSVNVLVVEDNPTNRVFAERVLQKAGHRVVTATNGQEALDILAARQFEIVFMDLLMPVMNGLEAAREIRARERRRRDGSRVPIVALTAHVLEEQRKQCLDAGMDMHLGKPVHGSDLLDAVYRLVERDETDEPKDANVPRDAQGIRTPPTRPEQPASTTSASSPAVEGVGEDHENDSLMVFDLNRLLDMLGGDRGLLDELLEEFAAQRIELIEELRQSLARNAADEGAKLAHKLKGSLLALCADASSTQAKKLELTLRAGDVESGHDILSRLLHELDALDQALTSLSRP